MKLGVYIGRFQPFHNGHLHVVRQALKECDRLLILVGSAHEPRSVKNPWTASERRDMIANGLPSDIPDVVDTYPIVDIHNDLLWAAQVREVVNIHTAILCEEDAQVSIVGHLGRALDVGA